jgi:hypothetical protein
MTAETSDRAASSSACATYSASTASSQAAAGMGRRAGHNSRPPGLGGADPFRRVLRNRPAAAVRQSPSGAPSGTRP